MNFVTIDDIKDFSNLIIRYVTMDVAPEVDSVDFESFESAEDFLEFMEENPDFVVDILYCDVEMGGMSVVDLAEHIRKHYYIGRRIRKMIFVTSYRRLWIEYDGQIVGKISKPFDRNDIVSATLELIDSIRENP